VNRPSAGSSPTGARPCCGRRCCSPGAGRPARRWSRRAVIEPAAATADVLAGRARLLATVPLAAGSAVVALPAGAAAVRTVDAAGRPLADVPVAPVATVPFGDFGSGPQH
jgi:hypothetical protein